MDGWSDTFTGGLAITIGADTRSKTAHDQNFNDATGRPLAGRTNMPRLDCGPAPVTVLTIRRLGSLRVVSCLRSWSSRAQPCWPVQQSVELSISLDQITFTSWSSRNRFILDAMGLATRERHCHPHRWAHSGGRRERFQAIRRIRALAINAAIDLEFLRVVGCAGFLSRARYRVGFHAFGERGPYRGDLTHYPQHQPLPHTAANLSMLVEAAVQGERLPTFDLEPVVGLASRFCRASEQVDQARALLKEASPQR